MFLVVSCKEDDAAFDLNTKYNSSELLVNTLVNGERARLGLDEIVYDESIAAIARSHSQAMASGAVPFGHDGSDGREAKIKALYKTISVGENITYNSGTYSPEIKAVSDWMGIQDQRFNILGNYNRTGVGIAKSASGSYYFTQIFARIETTSIFY